MTEFHVIAVDQLSRRIRLWEFRDVRTNRLLGTMELSPGQTRFRVFSDFGDFVSESFYEAKDEFERQLNVRRTH